MERQTHHSTPYLFQSILKQMIMSFQPFLSQVYEQGLPDYSTQRIDIYEIDYFPLQIRLYYEMIDTLTSISVYDVTDVLSYLLNIFQTLLRNPFQEISVFQSINAKTISDFHA